MNLEVVSDDRNHPSKASVKVLYGFNILRLHFSTMSLPGVLEDMEVPHKPGDGLIKHASIL